MPKNKPEYINLAVCEMVDKDLADIDFCSGMLNALNAMNIAYVLQPYKKFYDWMIVIGAELVTSSLRDWLKVQQKEKAI